MSDFGNIFPEDQAAPQQAGPAPGGPQGPDAEGPGGGIPPAAKALIQKFVEKAQAEGYELPQIVDFIMKAIIAAVGEEKAPSRERVTQYIQTIMNQTTEGTPQVQPTAPAPIPGQVPEGPV